MDIATDGSQLGDAIRALREIVERKLRSYRMAARDEMLADLGRMQALELGIEELMLFSQAPDAYLVTDSNGKISEANRAAAEMLGASATHLPENWSARLQRADGTHIDVEFAVGSATHPGTGALLLLWLVRAVE